MGFSGAVCMKNREEQAINPQKSDCRAVVNLNNNQKTRYQLSDSPNSVYGDALSQAFWGFKHSDYSNSCLFGTPKEHLQIKQKVEKNSVPVNIKKSIKTKGIKNDFYLNPMHWCDNGLIYLGLGARLYSYKASSHRWQKIEEESEDNGAYITAVCATANNILYSTSYNAYEFMHPKLSLIDSTTGKQVSEYYLRNRHTIIRSDKSNTNVFYVGSYECGFGCWDMRQSSYSYYNLKKEKEICGMSLNGNMIATGDDGNRIHIWDLRNHKAPFFSNKSHIAAVKALAFSPFKDSILASAGGMGDNTLRIWDVKTLKQITMQNTQTQTCNLHWIDSLSIFTTHGYVAGGSDPLGPKMHVWKMKDNKELKLAGSGAPEEGRKLFSTPNPNDFSEVSTGSPQKGVEQVKLGALEEPSVLSTYHKKNMIR